MTVEEQSLAPIETGEKTPQRSLVKKLCEIMAVVKYIQKKGRNSAQNYNYATEADVADALRDELSKRNVFIFPNCVKNERNRLERVSGQNTIVSFATDLEMEWTFEDGDSGETRTCRIPGCSQSPGDKGVYVAQTGSEKYLLMKAFLIPTGDDPESDDNEPRGTAEDAKAVGEAKLAAYKAREATQTAKLTSGTTQTKESVKSAPQAQPGDFNAAVADADAQRINSEVFGDANDDFAATDPNLPEGFIEEKINGVSKIVGKDKKFYDVTFGKEIVRYFINHDDDPTHKIFESQKGQFAVLKLSEKKGKYPANIRGILKIGTADLSKLEGNDAA